MSETLTAAPRAAHHAVHAMSTNLPTLRALLERVEESRNSPG